MFDHRPKIGLALVYIGLAGGALWAQAPKPLQYKDQGEYEIYNSVSKEKEPQKQLDLLTQWEQKYPDSDYKGNRAILTAQALSAIASKGLQPGATPADLDAAWKADQQLLSNLDKYLAPENKPAAVSEDQWKQAKRTTELQAHMLLGSMASVKKDDATAEAQFRGVLELTSDSAAAAYQLGTTILKQQKPERFPEGLYELARAAVITGPNALAPPGKKAAEDYLAKAYAGYHGDTSGLDDLKTTAAQSPFPPPGFTIKSVTQVANERAGDAAAFAGANPDIALWRSIRDALTGDGGDKYFTDQVKGYEVAPDGKNGFTMFRAKVVSQPSPNQLLVSVDGQTPDATLQFETPFKGTVEPGTAIKFKGVADTYVKNPFMITFTDLGREDVDGLPADAFSQASAAPKRSKTVKKK